MTITLRENQIRFDRDVKQALLKHRRVVGVAPTGFGKRIWACDALCRTVEKGKRALLVTDRQILVRQARNECREHNIPYGVIMGSEPRNDDSPIQIASLQTLSRRNWQDNPAANWIIIDECHKATAQYKQLIDHYPDAYVCGLTATPVGADDKLLVGGIFNAVVEPVKNTELIREGWLLPTKVICPCEPNVKGVKISRATGEFNEYQLSERVESIFIHANLWKWWETYRDAQTIVFVPRLKFARFLVEEFGKRGHAADIIEAATSTSDRDDLFERFATRQTRVMISVDVLREGFDSPIAQVALDLQPNAKLRTWWQKVGRIKRPYEGQDHCVLLDFAGNYWRHIHPDQDPEWPTNGQKMSDLVKKKKEAEPKEPWQCPVCRYTLSPWETLRDNKCPQCGTALAKATRRIVMGNGKMQEVSAIQKKKIKTNSDVNLWFGCLYPVLHSGRALNMARVFFHNKTGRWPDGASLPFCPKNRDSTDWNRRASDVYPHLLRRKR
jgi:superfamily II DNA or RNA helicase